MHDFEIFYDADCPVCRRIAEWVERVDTRGAICLSDINEEGYMLELLGVEMSEAYRVVHALRQTTTINYVVTKGPNVARITFDILGYRRLHRFISMPVVRHIFDAGFNFVSRYRRFGW